MTALPSPKGNGDLRSGVAFSLLFIVPAAISVALWIVLRVLDEVFGRGELALYPWLLLVVPPGILSAAIAQWGVGGRALQPPLPGGSR
jgi:hypothetical protein